MKVTIKASVTPAKDRLWDIIYNDGYEAVLDELMARLSEDEAREVWEDITGFDFDDNEG